MMKRHTRTLVVSTLVALPVLVAIGGGLAKRARAAAKLGKETRELAVPTVAVAPPAREDVAPEIVLPGNIQAFTDAPIYARTNGYLKRWYVDIGTKVKPGQLLAEIDAPEVDQQLHQARADLATAEANAQLARSTAARWKGLLESDSVSPQETDEKLGDLEAKTAVVESARSNVRRLEETRSFQRITAPFDGVITARNVDVGALIEVGTGNGPGRELFHLAATERLRVYVNVPQAHSRSAVPGATAEITLAERPDRTFQGTLVRTAEAIDPVSRTLLAEIDVDNESGELLPGAYAQVHLHLRGDQDPLVVPATALLFRAEGPRVAVLKDGKVELVDVTLGRDLGNAVEIASGLKGDEQIIQTPPDSVIEGQEVRVARSDK
jgi:RND family efflux transporter MFP subunit